MYIKPDLLSYLAIFLPHQSQNKVEIKKTLEGPTKLRDTDL